MRRFPAFFIISVALCLATWNTLAQPPRVHKLLAVVPHPDDEIVVGPLLARYARQPGTEVYIAVATNGELGVQPGKDIPAGSFLAAVRAKEEQCACQKLGVNEPILMGFPDGNLAAGPLLEQLSVKLREVIHDVQPDAIVVYGPDGFSGHPDHRLVSAVLTQLVQSDSGMPSLFYVGIPSSRMTQKVLSIPNIPRFHPTLDEYLNVRVRYSPADFARAFDSHQCHQSQINPALEDGLKQFFEIVDDGTIYLRSWNGGESRSELF